MGDGMPYMVTKGPVWQFFDDWFSGANPAPGETMEEARLSRKIDALIAVHTNSAFLAASPGGEAPPAPAKNWPNVKNKNPPANEIPMPDNHFTHWFDTGGQSFGDCNTLGPKLAKTGWWAGWFGDAEAIVREAFIRTIEVSLELDHVAWSKDAEATDVMDAYGGLAKDVAYTRNWALDFTWVCPQPMFRASVKWRTLGTGPADGLVSLMFLTPGLSSPDAGLAWSLKLVPNPKGPSKWARPATKEIQSEAAGSWIIGHENTLVSPTKANSLGPGSPPPENYSCGAVITIAPELHDGGVD